jgi:uncharacterized protein (DUF1810 family)
VTKRVEANGLAWLAPGARPSKAMNDPFDLDRFVRAQEGDYERALAELTRGRKQSHWMWYIFPQFAGLGQSPTSQRYAIKSLGEARAYLAHPILGARLIESANAVLRVNGRSANDIFGSPDDLKLKSSATLFSLASSDESVFRQIIHKYFHDERDDQTLELVRREHPIRG